MDIYRVKENKLYGSKDFKEIGCIIIPKGTEKESFKNLCFNEERFWVMTNKRGLLSNVPCIHQVVI